MKRHQEILEIIAGIIGLGVLCFFAYKAYQFVIEFPFFFGAVGGVLILWLLYNFRITAARISIYVNPKISYNLLKNHLEKGRAVALKKYTFGKAVYYVYSKNFYAGKKAESEQFKDKLKQTESYLTDSLDLIKERNEKFKEIWKKENFEKIDKGANSIFKDKLKEKEFFAAFKIGVKLWFKMMKLVIYSLFQTIFLFAHYSSLKSPKVYYHRGITRLANEKYELALEDFEESIEDYYDKKRVLYDKSRALYNLKRYQESIKVLEEILEIDSKYQYAIYKRGSAHYKLGNTEVACKDWKLAIEYRYKEDEEEKEKRKERCATC